MDPLTAARITEELDIARLTLAGELAAASTRVRGRSLDGLGPLCQEPVRRFARSAREIGATVERMVIALKESLAESELSRLDHRSYANVREQLLRVALDAFFDHPSPGGGVAQA